MTRSHLVSRRTALEVHGTDDRRVYRSLDQERCTGRRKFGDKLVAVRTLSVVALTCLAGTSLDGRHTFAAQTLGPVTDDVGVVEIPKGAPIQIGGYWVLSGPDTAGGLDAKRGAAVAIKDANGSLLGHPLQINAEDDQCTAEGGQTAAKKLAANPQTVIVIGPNCSSAAEVAAPILWQAGIANIGTGSSAPSLTAPTRKPEYAGFARTIFGDSDQGEADAEYAFNKLKARTVVTIHDGSPYARQLTVVMATNFQKLGGKVLSQEAVAPTDVETHPVLTRIAIQKPDVIYFPIWVAAGAQILRQSKDTAGLEKATFLGGGALLSPAFIEAAGPVVVGFQIVSSDSSPAAMGKSYPKLIEEYKQMFGEAPISTVHATGYDGAVLAMKAIEKVAKSDEAGNLYIGKKALRDAVLTTKFDGTSGPIECDPYGECGKFKPAAYEFTSADPKSFAIGTNPKRVWP